MAKLRNEPLLDRDTLSRLDAEVERVAAAGAWPAIRPPDPATDPFGSGYDWLDLPEAEGAFARVYVALVGKPPAEWYLLAGGPARATFLANSLASGTDEEVLRRWARENFVAFCHSEGEDGADLLDHITAAGDRSEGLVREVTDVLSAHPRLAGLTLDQRVALALVVIDTLAPPPAQPA